MTMLQHQNVSERRSHHGVYCGKTGAGDMEDMEDMEQTANVRDTAS